MTGFEVQEYLYAVDKALDLGIEIKPKGDKLSLEFIKGGMLGVFDSVKECYVYLCGYEYGLSRGKVFGVIDVNK